MRLSRVAKQWAFIVSEFEGAVKAQRSIMKEMKQGNEAYAYHAGRLNVLEMGLAQAMDRQRSLRLAFWKKPVTSDRHLLLMFLTELAVQVDRTSHKKTEFRSGMEDALNEWIAVSV